MRIRSLAINSAAHIRFVLIPAIWLALFAYAGRPIVVAAQAGGIAPFFAWLAVFLLSMLPLLPVLGRRGDDLRRRSLTHWAGYTTLGLFSLLLTLGLLSDVFRFVEPFLRATIRPQTLSYAVLGSTALLSIIGLLQARNPRVKRVEIAIDSLPPELDGYRIVQWSDVHVGPTIQRRFVANLVEKTNLLHADAIVITGDLIDGYVDELREQVTPLADLRARDGVFFVTGNHEYYWRAGEWVQELESLGLIFLKNSHRVIDRDGAKLAIAGITDPMGRHTHQSEPKLALFNVPKTSVKVLLAHRPQGAEVASKLGVDLQLSGHTHGGQFFPFNYIIRLFQPVVAGLHRVGRTWLYVSRGTGYWGPPSRLGVHGEITEVVLKRAA
ncbi:MAG: metallophosphoesterase [Thermoanaerobaculia bacterium]